MWTNIDRPLKIIFESKEDSAKLLMCYNNLKLNGFIFLHDYRIVPLQCEILKSRHAELDQRTQDGEADLRIIYVNGLP